MCIAAYHTAGHSFHCLTFLISNTESKLRKAVDVLLTLRMFKDVYISVGSHLSLTPAKTALSM